ncbi:hypothetical protein J1C56_05875 [Aminobacter anthyllidis]|uniref:Uncharacterized protein n=1 Tax=Aminobacter anthyllidis TaxID=1035067 RepID=A0A9X1A8A9_9HYPH|nr:hypothetical protein [Aminobacter anthyllidis]MBT1155114.1 hypothetical protein [Aminobacter anthyllidis]
MGEHGFRNKHSGKGRDKGGLLGAVLGAIGSQLGDKTSGGQQGGNSGGGGPSGNLSGAFGRDGRFSSAKTQRPSRMPRFGTAATLVVLVLWTLLAWLGYSLVDVVLAWTSSNVGTIVQTGKDAATATGIGTEVVGVVDSAETSGMLGGFLALVGAVLRPLIVVVWLGGAVLIMAAPWLVSLIRRKFR